MYVDLWSYTAVSETNTDTQTHMHAYILTHWEYKSNKNHKLLDTGQFCNFFFLGGGGENKKKVCTVNGIHSRTV